MSKHTNKVHGKLNFLIVAVVLVMGAVTYLFVQSDVIDFNPSDLSSSGNKAIKGAKKAVKYDNSSVGVVDLDGEDVQQLLNSQDFQKMVENPEFAKAMEFANNPEFAKAMDYYKRAYSKSSDKIQKIGMSFRMAECARKIGNYRQAESYYKRTIKMRYDDPIAIYYLGMMQRNIASNKTAEKAVSKYNEAIKSFQNQYPKLKEVMVEWYNNNKLNHKLQKLPMGRKKKLEG